MAQFGRPDGDVTKGAWTQSTGVTLYGCIDEASLDDADYVVNTGNSSTMEVSLSNPTDPTASTDHILRVRSKRNASGASGTAYLFQGTTQICSLALSATTSFVTSTHTLTAGEADAITDYSDLRIRVTGTKLQVSWAELEVPNVAVFRDFAGTIAIVSSTPVCDLALSSEIYNDFTATIAVASTTPSCDLSVTAPSGSNDNFFF